MEKFLIFFVVAPGFSLSGAIAISNIQGRFKLDYDSLDTSLFKY